MAKLSRKVQFQQMVDSDRKFMQDRGDSLYGYMMFYRPYGRSDDNIKAIYEADVAHLRSLEKMAGAAR